MREIHEGLCGLHIGERSFATKVVCTGYYWPTLGKNALDFTKALGAVKYGEWTYWDHCQRL